MEKAEKKNILVVIIGIFLVFLIGFFTFFRLGFGKKQNETNVSPYSDYAESVKKSKKISNEDLRQKILQKENVTVIDIRPKETYSEEHILDSINIPFPELPAALPSLDKEKTYVLVDDGSSLQAAYIAGSLFEKNEFKYVFYLSGGFLAWKDKINLIVSQGDPNSFSDQAKVTYVNSDELKKIIENESGSFIIDLRENAEQFKAEHLKNSVNIPLENLEKERKTIPLGKRIVLYDETGLRAFRGAVVLYDMGFLNVLTLSDGLKTWQEKGYEVVR
jgi:rhodanese-related sulfurtransferase